MKRVILWMRRPAVLALVGLGCLAAAILIPPSYERASYYDVASGRILLERRILGITVSRRTWDTAWTKFVADYPVDAVKARNPQYVPPKGYLISLSGAGGGGHGPGMAFMQYAEDLIQLTEDFNYSTEAKALAVNEFIRLANEFRGYWEARSFLSALRRRAESTGGEMNVNDVRDAVRETDRRETYWN